MLCGEKGTEQCILVPSLGRAHVAQSTNIFSFALRRPVCVCLPCARSFLTDTLDTTSQYSDKVSVPNSQSGIRSSCSSLFPKCRPGHLADEGFVFLAQYLHQSVCRHPRGGHPVNHKSVLLNFLLKPVVMNIDVLELSRKLRKFLCQETNHSLIVT